MTRSAGVQIDTGLRRPRSGEVGAKLRGTHEESDIKEDLIDSNSEKLNDDSHRSANHLVRHYNPHIFTFFLHEFL